MWTCPKCGMKVDPSFDVCWSCGTSQDGVEDPTFVRADDVPPSDPTVETDDSGPQEAPAGVPGSPGADLVECYWALDLMQAKFLADRLSEEGIPAVSDEYDMHETLGSMSSSPRIWVRAEDLPRAKAWLDAYDEQHKADHSGGQ